MVIRGSASLAAHFSAFVRTPDREFDVMSTKAASRQIVSATKDAVSCELGGGVALLDLRSNVYYSLNSVGADIWELIQEPKSVSEICDAIIARYDVEPARCRADVDGLLKGLADAGLVRLRDEELI